MNENDVERITELNQARCRWAKELENAEKRKLRTAEKAARAVKLARRRRQALADAFWVSGVFAGILAFLCGVCIVRNNPLLAVAAALGMVAFALTGAMVYEWLEI